MTAPLQTLEIRIIREFDAPIETVFRAWTVPAELAAWYGPAQFDTSRTRSASTCAWAHATSSRWSGATPARRCRPATRSSSSRSRLARAALGPHARLRHAGARDHAGRLSRPRRPYPHAADRRALPRGLRTRRDGLELVVRPAGCTPRGLKPSVVSARVRRQEWTSVPRQAARRSVRVPAGADGALAGRPAARAAAVSRAPRPWAGPRRPCAADPGKAGDQQHVADRLGHGRERRHDVQLKTTQTTL